MEVRAYTTITTATPSIFKQQVGMMLPIRGEVLRDEPKILYDLLIRFQREHFNDRPPVYLPSMHGIWLVANIGFYKATFWQSVPVQLQN